ncbi:hypothetical protein [uncultured Paraglaciecola sp.]|uniref:hypothetical protein n=1 Tax=uncultured Paraglaciecola sp. TaxID=1765024 RepID=UPI002631E26D|nr:hypothetical protein [uncultured Paraglaciecola sp.]
MKCHHTAFKKDCCKHDCVKWLHVQGYNPQTGTPVDEFKCADAWVPLLLIDISRQTSSVGAAVESERNIIDKNMQAAISLAANQAKQLHHTQVES